jgi:hypothetical protein
VINQVRPIYVNFAVPEQNLPEVRKYMASGPLAVDVVPPDAATARIGGRLIFVDNAVDPSTGTIRLRAQFDITISPIITSANLRQRNALCNSNSKSCKFVDLSSKKNRADTHFSDSRISRKMIHGWDGAVAIPGFRVESRLRHLSGLPGRAQG